MIQRPAPPFEGKAVVDGEFKTIRLSDYLGASPPCAGTGPSKGRGAERGRRRRACWVVHFTGSYVVLFFYPYDLCGQATWHARPELTPR